MSSAFATAVRAAVNDAPDDVLQDLVLEIRSALEGDSNDAEHDALVVVADVLKIPYYPNEV